MEHQTQEVLDQSTTQSIGAEWEGLRARVTALRRQEEAVRRQLEGGGKGKGPYRSRGELLHDLRDVTWWLEREQQRLERASQEAGSHYEQQNVPRGGQ